MTVPSVTLNSGYDIPQRGFGVFLVPPAEAEKAVSEALEVGYRHIDTAAIYKNEKGVGEGIGDWADIFLQTKIWNESQGYERTKNAAQKCLARLGRDHVDMLLIHDLDDLFHLSEEAIAACLAQLYSSGWRALDRED